MENELAAVLRAIAWDSLRLPEPCAGADAGVVFCAIGPAFHEARALYPQTPVVVVSRLPEWNEWVEALEAGAADYCAAPFEPRQIRWILETQSKPAIMTVATVAVAAAAA